MGYDSRGMSPGGSNMRIRWWGLVIAPLTAVGLAQSDSLPSDGELRSAYCIPVLKWQITQAKSIAAVANAADGPRNDLPQLESALNRLQLYLLPRIAYRDPVSLMGAQKRGEADTQELESMTQRCSARCLGADKGNHEQQGACWNSCADSGLIDRMRACRNPSWLPF
jgi:hypothetical protein